MLFAILLLTASVSASSAKPTIPEDLLYTVILPSVDTDVIVGQSLTLTCECTSKLAEVKMVRNEVENKYTPIPDNMTSFVKPKFYWSRKTLTYKIEAAKLSDAGDYTCMATYKGETMVYSPGIEVAVFENTAPKIKIESEMKNLTIVNYKSQIKLYCEAQGYPPPSVKWFKDGKDLQEKSSKPFRFCRHSTVISLVIKEFTERDAGNYTCKASNRNGQTKADVHVTLKAYPPKIHSTDITVHSNMSVTLDCTVIGYPFPTITWYKNDDIISCSESQMSFHNYPQCSLSEKMTSVEIHGKPKIFRQRGIKMIVPTVEKLVAVQSKLQTDASAAGPLDLYSCKARNHLGFSSHTFKAYGVIRESLKIVQ